MKPTYEHGESERQWLAMANSELRSELLALQHSLTELVETGNKLAQFIHRRATTGPAVNDPEVAEHLITLWVDARDTALHP